MLFKKYRSKKHAQNSANSSLSKEGRIDFLVKKYHAEVPSKTLAKSCSREKTVLKYSSCFISERNDKTSVDSIYLLFGKVPDKHFAQNTDNQAQPKNERNGTLVKMLSLRNATQNTDEKRYL